MPRCDHGRGNGIILHCDHLLRQARPIKEFCVLVMSGNEVRLPLFLFVNMNTVTAMRQGVRIDLGAFGIFNCRGEYNFKQNEQ